MVATRRSAISMMGLSYPGDACMLAQLRIRAQPRAGRSRAHSLSWRDGHLLLRLRAGAPAARALPRPRLRLPAARRARPVRTPAAGAQPGRPDLENARAQARRPPPRLR